MRDLEDLHRLIDSGTPLVFLDTHDHARCDALFERLARRVGRPAWRWTLATGMRPLTGISAAPVVPGTEAAQVLAQVLAMRDAALFFFGDLDKSLGEALVASQLREIAVRHDQVPHHLLVVAQGQEVPSALRPFAARFELSLPSPEELATLVHEEAASWGAKTQRRVQATQTAIDALVRNLSGLSLSDSRRLIRNAIRDDGVLDESDLPELVNAKYALLDQGGVLSFELSGVKLDDVAGLTRMKSWLGERREIFLAEQPPPGFDAPKGLLLLGVQGAGKSLASKAVAGAFGVPLLRLDFAALYNKYYGETERNLRESLRTAGAMAPCVLWIDEIEKGLAQEGDDGGPGKRILGTLLTWMAERKNKVFLVATANDIESLPPELLRKGRFDEIFFVDLPKPEVRETVFAIHLKKRGQDVATFDLKQLAEASDGFSGAEIEQAVVAALYAARAASTALTTDSIKAQLAATKPLSVVMAEKILYLRAWAAERTVPAD